MPEVAAPPSPQVSKPAVHSRNAIRKWVALAHLWVGLPVGLLVCLFTLAGSTIVFRAEIERAFEPKRQAASCESSVDLGTAADQVMAFVPGSAISQIDVPMTPRQNYQFIAKTAAAGSTRVVYDGCSGTVLGVLKLPLLNWLVDFHHNLLAGKTGRQATGVIGMVLFSLALSGLAIWLLSKPKLQTAFVVSRKGPNRLFMWQLHRAAGLGALVFLSISSITGISLAYPDTVRRAVDRLMGTQADAKPAKSKKKKSTGESSRLRPLADYAAVVAAAIPGGKIRELSLPDSSGPLQLRVWAPGDYRRSGSSRVNLDPATLAVVSASRFSDAPASLKVTQGATALHYAEWGGITIQILWFIAGLMPSILFGSGVMIWWLRRKPRIA